MGSYSTEEKFKPQDGFKRSYERRQKKWQRPIDEMEELQSSKKQGMIISQAEGPWWGTSNAAAGAVF